MEVTATTLLAAAERFAMRTDDFAIGKASICADLAAKLERFGAFASEKQYQFAAKLVTWSLPRAAQPAIELPNIAALVEEKNLALNLGVCKVVKFNTGAIGIVSPIFGAGVFGVIEDGKLKRFAKCTDEMVAVLQDVEARGLEAVKEIGKATGRCCVCSRTLTNEGSIEAGIGPICAQYF